MPCIRLPAVSTHQRRKRPLLGGHDFRGNRRRRPTACSTPKCCGTPPRPCFIISKSNWTAKRVTVGEFALALEKVLRHLGFTHPRPRAPAANRVKSATPIWACWPANPAAACELFFFPRLRDELRVHLRAFAARGAFSRPARLRQTTRRRAPLELPLRTVAGPNRRLSARCLTAETAQNQPMRAGGGIKSEWRKAE